jgi:stage III sporulation protein AH
MMVLKRKQIVVLSLVMMIVIAGYLQYSYKRSSISVSEIADDGSPKLGEAIYVDNSDALESEVSDKTEDLSKKDSKKEDSKKEDSKKEDSKKEDNKKDDSKKEDKKTVQASKEANSYFAQAKIDRDVTRGKNKEELQSIVNDPEANKELKTQANEKMLALIEKSDREMAIESLIKEKGFSDVVALIADDKSIDIIVKAQSLTDAEVAQISDIASRQANIDISKVHIRPIF